MEFTFSIEQDALRAGARSVLDDVVATGLVRAFVDGDVDAAESIWSRTCEQDWCGILVPTDHGGLGLGLLDALVVLEEAGRVTLPGPFVSSSVVATVAARDLGADSLLADLASGARRGTVALEEAGDGDPIARVRTVAEVQGNHHELTGAKPVVLDPGADWVIVAARTADGVGSFLLEDPDIVPVRALDPTRSVGRLELAGTPATAIGPPGDHGPIWSRLSDIAAVAFSAELVGVCDAAFAMAVAYGGERVQFGVPLASHQVTQHKYVDMLHRIELGRVGVHRAAWTLDADDPGATEAVAIAKSTMGEAAVFVTAENIQVHGAVGFTWASDAHLLYKRAKQNDALGGSRTWHRSRVADAFLGA